MKKVKKITVAILLVTSSFWSQAQVDFGTFLEAGVGDANTILEKYLEPAFLGFGYGINSGWYNTAKPHKLFGIDITPTITLANVPSKGEFFTFNNSDYENIRLESGTSAKSPTLFGPNLPADDLPLLIYTSNPNTPDENEIILSAPTGLGLDEELPFNAVPSGMVQVGIGIMKNTDIKFRIIPKIESEGEYAFEMFGIGIMHDLKQWVPGFKQLPIDVSGFVGWNRMKATLFLDEDNPDQLAEFSTYGFTLQGLVSKQFSVLTLFAGAGIANTKTNFKMEGTYDTEAGILRGSDGDLPEFSFTSTGPRINAGFRLKLLILTLHMDYAIQKYSTLTTGIGISIR